MGLRVRQFLALALGLALRLDPHPFSSHRRYDTVMRLSGILTCLTICSSLALAADQITFERVIGTEFPGKYKHPASIEELASGDLYIAYYGGDGEYADVTAVYGMRKRKGESKWSE